MVNFTYHDTCVKVYNITAVWWKFLTLTLIYGENCDLFRNKNDFDLQLKTLYEMSLYFNKYIYKMCISPDI